MRHLLLLVPLVACKEPGIVVGELQDTLVMKAIPNRDLDLLFVIDDSPSMLDKQVALAEAFPQMMDVLSQLDGGLPNLHIGVVTSDMGTSATESVPGPAIGQIGQGGCSGNGKFGELQTNGAPISSGNFLSDIGQPDGTRQRNYTGELREVFGQMARVGAGGCGFEQHLSALSSALSNSANAGFVRPAANLAVVVLADEDDCSARDALLFGPASQQLGSLQSFRCFRQGVTCNEPSDTVGVKTGCEGATGSAHVIDVQPVIDQLIATKSDDRKVMVGVVAGNPSPVEVVLRALPGGGPDEPALGHSCTIDYPTGPSVADPAVRLQALVDAFPGRSTFTSVCSPDLSNPLHQIGESAKALMGGACLDSAQLADIDLGAPGVQPSCEVVDIADSAPDVANALAECSSGAPDCYEIVPDAAGCPSTEDHLRVRFNRASAVHDDTWTYVRCKRAQ